MDIEAFRAFLRAKKASLPPCDMTFIDESSDSQMLLIASYEDIDGALTLLEEFCAQAR